MVSLFRDYGILMNAIFKGNEISGPYSSEGKCHSSFTDGYESANLEPVEHHMGTPEEKFGDLSNLS